MQTIPSRRRPLVRSLGVVPVFSTAIFLLSVGFEQAGGAEERTGMSEWGDESGGLQCRIASPVKIEQGMPLDVEIQFRSVPPKLDPRTKALNAFLRDAFLELSLTNSESKKVFALQPYDPTYGMLVFDEGKNVIPLNGTAIKPWRIRFPLAKMYNELAPGAYEGQVRFSFPAGPTSWWRGTAEQWERAGFWHGSIRSRPFGLKITKQSKKTKTVLLPKRLSALAEKDEQGRPVTVVRLREQDAEKVALPVKNGHFLGWKASEAGMPGFMMQGGTPRFDDANPIAVWSDKKPRKKRSITIEVFESAVRAHHHWMPEASGYSVLWKETFTVPEPRMNTNGHESRDGSDK